MSKRVSGALAGFLPGDEEWVRLVQLKCDRCPQSVVGAVFLEDATGSFHLQYRQRGGKFVHRLSVNAAPSYVVECPTHGEGNVTAEQLRRGVADAQRRQAQRNRRRAGAASVVPIVCGQRYDGGNAAQA